VVSSGANRTAGYHKVRYPGKYHLYDPECILLRADHRENDPEVRSGVSRGIYCRTGTLFLYRE